MSELEKILQAIVIFIKKGDCQADYYVDEAFLYNGDKKYHKNSFKHSIYKYIKNRQPVCLYNQLKLIIDEYYSIKPEVKKHGFFG